MRTVPKCAGLTGTLAKGLHRLPEYLADLMSSVPIGEQLVATILKHDSKTTSYKFALLRALNDIVLGHPDLALAGELPVAVPLRRLAE